MSRVAVVTGGTRGIGEAISLALQDAGMTVAANYAGNDEKARAFAVCREHEHFNAHDADIGKVGDDMSAGVAQQTRETLANIERLLDLAGTDKHNLLSVTIYLKDIDAHFEGMNAVWDTWVVAGHTPPRATVQAALANPAWRIEIVVTAAVRG